MKKILISSIAISALTLISCNTDFERDVNNMTISNGTADFKTYVALGNSLTAGYRDGSLYLDGQNESYPSMIAQQLALAGSSQTFKQPLMPNNIGGFKNIPGFNGKLFLQLNESGELGLGTNTAAADLDNVSTGAPYQNLGVPGAKSFHLGIDGYATLNPYFSRFATSATTSVIKDAVAQKPTFFSLWIGNNDVLSYATSGGIGVDRTGDLNAAGYGSNDITDPNVLKSSINGYVTALKAAGAKGGVIANIPSVTSIPFFTRVPYNPLQPKNFNTAAAGSPSNQDANIDALNQQLYGLLNGIFTAYGEPNRVKLLSKTSNSPLLIVDETAKDRTAEITAYLTPSLGATTAAAFGQIFGKARQTTGADLILLSTSSLIGTVNSAAPSSINKYGISYPFQDQHILIPSEISAIKTATDSYNTAIASIATSQNLALVDANAKMVELSKLSGIQYNGVRYTATFISGGTFSLDGVHLTGRGAAMIANEFIKAINNKYASTLPMVDVNHYSGVTFP